VLMKENSLRKEAREIVRICLHSDEERNLWVVGISLEPDFYDGTHSQWHVET